MLDLSKICGAESGGGIEMHFQLLTWMDCSWGEKNPFYC